MAVGKHKAPKPPQAKPYAVALKALGAAADNVVLEVDGEEIAFKGRHRIDESL